MNQGHETVLNLKYFDDNGKKVLKQKVQIVYDDGSSQIVWKEVEGQDVPVEASFSDRFKDDTFKPHTLSDVKTDVITKKIKLDTNIDSKNMTVITMMKHIESSIRVDNLLKKLLAEPSVIREKGFDFKDNVELKKAMTLMCYEIGGEWADIPSFFK